MKPITTVGELRAALAGLDDATPISAGRGFVFQAPGVYVVRTMAGSCTPASVELHLQQQHVTLSVSADFTLPAVPGFLSR